MTNPFIGACRAAMMHHLPATIACLAAALFLTATAAHAQSYAVDYTYDAQGRLTQATYSTGFTLFYSYDAAGNLLSVSDMEVIPVEDAPGLPERFALHASYPNPFNPTTIISFDVKASARVVLKVYNLLGQEVATVVDRDYAPGRYRASFDARALSSGVYLYRIKMGDFRDVKSMIFVK